MIFYSHIWDGLLKMASLALLVTVSVYTQPGWVLFSIMFAAWLVIYRQFLSTVSSSLYARMSLRTKVTFTEAKALRKLFQLDVSLRWIPLKEIKKLPGDQRHDALLAALERAGVGRKAMLF